MKAGASQINITPDRRVILAGSFEVRWAEDVFSPLFANAVAVDDGHARFIFISCDLLFLNDEITGELRQKIATITGAHFVNVVISYTHTHNAQGLFKCLPALPVDEELVIITKEKIIEAGKKAVESLTEAKMGYARGEAPCTFNRRCILANGKVWTSPGPDDPAIIGCEGPEDQEFQTIWFETLQGRIIGIMVNYSSHPTITFPLHKISADFPGAIRKVVQNSLGDDIPILYLQGASGNLSPFDFSASTEREDPADKVIEIGNIVGGRILDAMAKSKDNVVDSIQLSSAAKMFEAPARHNGGPDDLSLEEARDYITANPIEKIDHTSEPDMFRYYFADSVVKLEGAEHFKTHYPLEVSVYRLGDVVIATNPAELFVEYQFDIKARSPFDKTIIVQLTNGYCGYVLTERALQGGYEAHFAVSSCLAPAAGRIMVQEVLKLINKQYRIFEETG